MDSMKICFKCNKRKNIESFYKHNRMRDGHLNKCITCAKKDVHERYDNPLFKIKIKEYEQRRFKDPSRKKKVLEYQRARRVRNPGKAKARNKIRNYIRDGKLFKRPCETCGDNNSQVHHLDYRSPLKVKWLCFKHHRQLHGQNI